MIKQNSLVYHSDYGRGFVTLVLPTLGTDEYIMCKVNFIDIEQEINCDIKELGELSTKLPESKKEEIVKYNYIKPSHYKLWNDMEDTFEPHKKLLTKEEYKGFLKGNILKYQLRLGKKPGESVERDMGKIKIYQEELNKIE